METVIAGLPCLFLLVAGSVRLYGISGSWEVIKPAYTHLFRAKLGLHVLHICLLISTLCTVIFDPSLSSLRAPSTVVSLVVRLLFWVFGIVVLVKLQRRALPQSFTCLRTWWLISLAADGFIVASSVQFNLPAEMALYCARFALSVVLGVLSLFPVDTTERPCRKLSFASSGSFQGLLRGAGGDAFDGLVQEGGGIDSTPFLNSTDKGSSREVDVVRALQEKQARMRRHSRRSTEDVWENFSRLVGGESVDASADVHDTHVDIDEADGPNNASSSSDDDEVVANFIGARGSRSQSSDAEMGSAGGEESGEPDDNVTPLNTGSALPNCPYAVVVPGWVLNDVDGHVDYEVRVTVYLPILDEIFPDVVRDITQMLPSDSEGEDDGDHTRAVTPRRPFLSYTLLRRFSMFKALSKEMARELSDYTNLHLPSMPTSMPTLASHDKLSFLKDRRVGLESFLQQCAHSQVFQCASLARFLTPDSNVVPRELSAREVDHRRLDEAMLKMGPALLSRETMPRTSDEGLYALAKSMEVLSKHVRARLRTWFKVFEEDDVDGWLAHAPPKLRSELTTEEFLQRLVEDGGIQRIERLNRSTLYCVPPVRGRALFADPMEISIPRWRIGASDGGEINSRRRAGMYKPVVRYLIVIRTLCDAWTVERRYSEFRQLHKKLQSDKVSSPARHSMVAFPSRQTLKGVGRSQTFLEKRRKRLEVFLQCVTNTSSFQVDTLAIFLDPDLDEAIVEKFSGQDDEVDVTTERGEDVASGNDGLQLV